MQARVLWIFPAWVFVYICLSAPLGRILDRHIRLIRYKTHPLLVAGEKIPEPLLAMLKDNPKEKSSSMKVRQSQRGGRRKRSPKEESSMPKSVNTILSPTAVQGECPVCDSTNIARGKGGRLRCNVCWESFRG